MRMPFTNSSSSTSVPFELIHCDVSTSPVLSISRFKYYLVIVDDFTHYCWTFPLRHKSEVHRHITDFVAYAHTQFSLPVRCFQANNGTSSSTTPLPPSSLAAAYCFAPRAQNGKAERMLRTLNNVVRTLLIHASMPPGYWAEALATAVFLLNRRPSSSSPMGFPTMLCSRRCQTIAYFESSAACAIRTSVPRHLTNWPHARLPACSLVTLLPRRVTAVSISTPVE
jgi:hypothetical protein